MPEPVSRPADITTSTAIAPLELRRLPPFQIFKQAFHLYRGSGLELIATTGAGYILLLILALFFNLAYQLLEVTQDEVLLTMFLTLGALSGLIVLLGIHIGVTAAVALVITGKFLGSSFSIVNTYRLVLQRWDSLLAALAVLAAAMGGHHAALAMSDRDRNSGDDAYEPATGAHPELSVPVLALVMSNHGGYSADDAYDPATGARPELSVPVEMRAAKYGGN